MVCNQVIIIDTLIINKAFWKKIINSMLLTDLDSDAGLQCATHMIASVSESQRLAPTMFYIRLVILIVKITRGTQTIVGVSMIELIMYVLFFI